MESPIAMVGPRASAFEWPLRLFPRYGRSHEGGPTRAVPRGRSHGGGLMGRGLVPTGRPRTWLCRLGGGRTASRHVRSDATLMLGNPSQDPMANDRMCHAFERGREHPQCLVDLTGCDQHVPLMFQRFRSVMLIRLNISGTPGNPDCLVHPSRGACISLR
jgi:hypothetical protein